MQQKLQEIIDENKRRVKHRLALQEASNKEREATRAKLVIDYPDEIDRCRENFEYWAEHCVKIKDKITSQMVPFRLNAPQRRVLAMLEADRRAGRPIRLIMLKARQWGGSTLVQMYMAWMQCTRRENWHSLICGQTSQSAANIRGMYERMLNLYPDHLWSDGQKPQLRPFQGQRNVREISGRGCCITLGSSERQDAIRGGDYAMAHLTEVAFWRDTPQSTPDDFIRAICGAIAPVADTMVVLESTANGVGNYFHSEWQRSLRQQSDKRTVFIPWYEIEIYSMPVTDIEALWISLDSYERNLWEKGLTLEQIHWYHNKRREHATHQQMMAEYPTTPDEAFTNTGNNVFSVESINRLRQNCTPPIAKGEVASASGAQTGWMALAEVAFVPDSLGRLQLWEHPTPGHYYVIGIDIGGRSVSSDWSVMVVIDEFTGNVVAQWRGHADHDLLAWKAATLGTYFNQALLVFESNTLESGEYNSGYDSGCCGSFLLHELFQHYPYIYYRTRPGQMGAAPGFHTNRATKQIIVARLIAAVRDGAIGERCAEACDEYSVYELRQNGSYGARQGHHDDMLMARAIAWHVIYEEGYCQRLNGKSMVNVVPTPGSDQLTNILPE